MYRMIHNFKNYTFKSIAVFFLKIGLEESTKYEKGETNLSCYFYCVKFTFKRAKVVYFACILNQDRCFSNCFTRYPVLLHWDLNILPSRYIVNYGEWIEQKENLMCLNLQNWGCLLLCMENIIMHISACNSSIHSLTVYVPCLL